MLPLTLSVRAEHHTPRTQHPTGKGTGLQGRYSSPLGSVTGPEN